MRLPRELRCSSRATRFSWLLVYLTIVGCGESTVAEIEVESGYRVATVCVARRGGESDLQVRVRDAVGIEVARATVFYHLDEASDCRRGAIAIELVSLDVENEEVHLTADGRSISIPIYLGRFGPDGGRATYGLLP